MVALPISETDGCLLCSKCYEPQWIRQSCHYLGNSSGTPHRAFRSPLAYCCLVDWRPSKCEESSFITCLVSRLLCSVEEARVPSLSAAAVDVAGCHDLPKAQKAIGGAMPLLPRKAGGDCLSQSASRRMYQMCSVAGLRRTSLLRANIE